MNERERYVNNIKKNYYINLLSMTLKKLIKTDD